MAKQYSLKDIVLMGLTLIIIAGGVTAYAHFSLAQRQAQREIIYLRARQMAAEQQRQQMRAYQKKLIEKRMTQQFQRGRVVSTVPQP